MGRCLHHEERLGFASDRAIAVRPKLRGTMGAPGREDLIQNRCPM
jgi:hypothetical protein